MASLSVASGPRGRRRVLGGRPACLCQIPCAGRERRRNGSCSGRGRSAAVREAERENKFRACRRDTNKANIENTDERLSEILKRVTHSKTEMLLSSEQTLLTCTEHLTRSQYPSSSISRGVRLYRVLPSTCPQLQAGR